METSLTLSEAYRSMRSLEAIENYARADAPFQSSLQEREALPGEPYIIGEGFWRTILSEPNRWWGQNFLLPDGALSEWVARVPGLFWSDGAEALRAMASSAIEFESGEWRIYNPRGKGQKVLGGVGTLKFPEDEHGRRLCTVSGNHNMSSGVPVLVYPEVWEHHRLSEGDILTIEGNWMRMDISWAERFPSIRGIPRGYILLRNPSQVKAIQDREQPTEIHPCTVMEYRQGGALLWDFVYAKADTFVPDYRQKLADFFEHYKGLNERSGRYLLSADINDPLWDAEYDSPEQLRRAEHGATAQIDLMKARLRERTFSGKTIETILDALARNFDIPGMRTLSDFIQLPPSLWLGAENIAKAAVQFMDACLEAGKVEELLDAMARQYPGLVTGSPTPSGGQTRSLLDHITSGADGSNINARPPSPDLPPVNQGPV